MSNKQAGILKLLNRTPGQKYWEVRAQGEDPKVGQLLIYGPIVSDVWWDNEVSAKMIRDELAKLGDVDRVEVYINSPGGSLFEAQAIASTLRRHEAEVVAYVDGLAASAASIVLTGADRVVIPHNGTIMVHSAMLLMLGYFNAKELRETADTLDQISKSILAAYREKTGLSDEEILAYLDAETWFVGQEAVDAGFADELEEGKEVAAFIDGNTLHVNGQVVDLGIFTKRPALPERSVGSRPADQMRGTAEVTISVVGCPEEIADRIRALLEGREGDSVPPDGNPAGGLPSNRQEGKRRRPAALSYFERKLAINERRMTR